MRFIGSRFRLKLHGICWMTPAPSVDEPPRYRRFLSVRYWTPKDSRPKAQVSRK
jgi:hypothetical protein